MNPPARFSWSLGAELPRELFDLARRSGMGVETPLILVDGLSGAGKSSVASALAAALSSAQARKWRVLGPDLWFPGWKGLRAAQEVTLALVENLRAGRPGMYRLWDWERSRALPPTEVRPGTPTIIEGCGALTRQTRLFADFAVWVEAEGGGAVRKERALARDGEGYRPWWECWELQDCGRLDSDRPLDFADAIVLT